MSSPDPRETSLDEQAAAWLVREADGLDAQGKLDLERWLAADSRNRQAYTEMQRVWMRLDELPAGKLDALMTPAAPPSKPWPYALAASLLLAVAVGGFWYSKQPIYEASFATAAQHQRMDIPDGSVLDLDTGARVTVALYRDHREARLLAGQAYFDVASEAARPFEVLAGDARIRVIGTRFSVRHAEDADTVAVEHGRVQVASTEPDSLGVLLSPGQSVAVDAHGVLSPVAKVPAATLAPWREGRVAFADASLAQVLEEFARYGKRGVFIRDPAVAALRITGSFEIDRFDRFVKLLPQMLPVRLSMTESGTEIAAP